MVDYFLDTADIGLIAKHFESANKAELSHFCNFLGVTTNPSAFSKIDKKSRAEWLEVVSRISEMVSDYRQDKLGEVHVQIPYSYMTFHQCQDWADQIKDAVGDSCIPVMKIAPYTGFNYFLAKSIKLNITGMADGELCAQASRDGTSYVSIIPGRMRENDIDPIPHMLHARKNMKSSTTLIAGSMRTVEDLDDAISCGAVPTIGPKVMDMVADKGYTSLKRVVTYSPHEESSELSSSFFSQMNKLGRHCYKETFDEL